MEQQQIKALLKARNAGDLDEVKRILDQYQHIKRFPGDAEAFINAHYNYPFDGIKIPSTNPDEAYVKCHICNCQSILLYLKCDYCESELYCLECLEYPKDTPTNSQFCYRSVFRRHNNRKMTLRWILENSSLSKDDKYYLRTKEHVLKYIDWEDKPVPINSLDDILSYDDYLHWCNDVETPPTELIDLDFGCSNGLVNLLSECKYVQKFIEDKDDYIRQALHVLVHIEDYEDGGKHEGTWNKWPINDRSIYS